MAQVQLFRLACSKLLALGMHSKANQHLKVPDILRWLQQLKTLLLQKLQSSAACQDDANVVNFHTSWYAAVQNILFATLIHFWFHKWEKSSSISWDYTRNKRTHCFKRNTILLMKKNLSCCLVQIMGLTLTQTSIMTNWMRRSVMGGRK